MGTCHYDDLESTRLWFPRITAISILPTRLLQKQNTGNLEGDMQFTLLLYNFDMIYDNVL